MHQKEKGGKNGIKKMEKWKREQRRLSGRKEKPESVVRKKKKKDRKEEELRKMKDEKKI